MLDVIVLIAMAVTATAFAAGLTVHSGVAMIPSVIAAAALYLVMAASYLMLSRQTKATPVTSRLQELEAAMEIIDGDLQRIDRVEDDVARLDLLNDRVERLDQAVSTIAPGEFTGSLARNDDFTAKFEQVHARIENLRTDLEGEVRNQRDKIAGDLRALEAVIKQISNELSATSAAAPLSGPPEVGPTPFIATAPEVAPVEVVEEVVAIYGRGAEEPVPVQEEVVPEEAVALPTGSLLEQAMLTVLNDAIEGGRVDLYLQPIVALPERKLRYYEGYTRLRTSDDEIVMPRDYLPVAETAGLMPIVDNVLLVKSVQLLRKLRSDSRVKGVFCNISVQSLLDRDFFPELVEFMEENSGLSESLVFEVSQPAILGLTRGRARCPRYSGRARLRLLARSCRRSRCRFRRAARPRIPFRQDRRHDLPARHEGEGGSAARLRHEGLPRSLRPQIDHREGRGRGRRGEAARLRRRACPGLSVRRAQGDEPAACARARRRRRGLIAVL